MNQWVSQHFSGDDRVLSNEDVRGYLRILNGWTAGRSYRFIEKKYLFERNSSSTAFVSVAAANAVREDKVPDIHIKGRNVRVRIGGEHCKNLLYLSDFRLAEEIDSLYVAVFSTSSA